MSDLRTKPTARVMRCTMADTQLTVFALRRRGRFAFPDSQTPTLDGALSSGQPGWGERERLAPVGQQRPG
jgi:hypothetical protein